MCTVSVSRPDSSYYENWPIGQIQFREYVSTGTEPLVNGILKEPVILTIKISVPIDDILQYKLISLRKDLKYWRKYTANFFTLIILFEYWIQGIIVFNFLVSQSYLFGLVVLCILRCVNILSVVKLRLQKQEMNISSSIAVKRTRF